ncbi:MAG: hypothetical protein ACK5CA_05015 [Cyanobacteriota bacterium]
MISLLKLLPKSLTTFLYAVAALLRFYGDSESIPFPVFRFTIVEWSLLVFGFATASLLVNLGLEWYAGNREADRRAEESERANEERRRAEEARVRAEAENFAERERAARRARIQNRWIILEIQHRFENSSETRSALRDFCIFLDEYGE